MTDETEQAARILAPLPQRMKAITAAKTAGTAKETATDLRLKAMESAVAVCAGTQEDVLATAQRFLGFLEGADASK